MEDAAVLRGAVGLYNSCLAVDQACPITTILCVCVCVLTCGYQAHTLHIDSCVRLYAVCFIGFACV